MLFILGMDPCLEKFPSTRLPHCQLETSFSWHSDEDLEEGGYEVRSFR
jgi:hypothetical protein